MKTRVISLKSATDRRANIAPQLGDLGIDYQFFDAIERDHGFDHFDGYDERQHRMNMGRLASPGEAACFASHRSLWKESVTTNEPIAILEDDSELEKNFPAALIQAQRLINKYGFIRLQNDFSGRHKKKIPVREAGSFTLNYYATYPFGAMGYVISPAVAAAFLDASRVLTAPVDAFIKQFWEHDQALYGLFPFSVMWGDFANRTTIGIRDRESLDFNLRLARRSKKIDRWIKRWKFNRVKKPRTRLHHGHKSPMHQDIVT